MLPVPRLSRSNLATVLSQQLVYYLACLVALKCAFSRSVDIGVDVLRRSEYRSRFIQIHRFLNINWQKGSHCEILGSHGAECEGVWPYILVNVY